MANAPPDQTRRGDRATTAKLRTARTRWTVIARCPHDEDTLRSGARGAELSRAEPARQAAPRACMLSTPSAVHAQMVKHALDLDVHVFCETPFTLAPADSSALAEQAAARQLVTQVGYHNRFVGTFAEVKRLLDLRAI